VTLIPLLIFGTGGHAREMLALVDAINHLSPRYDLLGWVDDRTDLRDETPLNLPLLGKLEDVYPSFSGDVQVVVAIGSSGARKRVATRIDRLGIDAAVLVHPSAHVGPDVRLGKGTMVCAGAILTAGIQVGQHALINSGSIVSHDGRIDDFVTIAPGVSLAGNVHVQTGADLGIGASVLPGLKIGSWSIVGGGATVTRNVPSNSTVVGSPARVIKQRAPGWEHD